MSDEPKLNDVDLDISPRLADIEFAREYVKATEEEILDLQREGDKKDALIRDLQQQLKTAREEERERCAKVCDERVERHDRHSIDGGSTFDAARADEAERIAAAIRSLGEKATSPDSASDSAG